MRQSTTYLIGGFLAAFMPAAALAFSLKDSNFSQTIMYVIGILALLNPILVALAFIVFFWGLSKFILNSGSKEGVEKGKDYMLWGVLALFILLTFRTIIGLVTNELEFGDSQNTPFLKTDAVTPETGGRIVDPGTINP